MPVFARATGFDHTKIKHIPADAAAAKASMLVGGVDATGIFWPEYPTLVAEAKKFGKELGAFKYSDFGLDLYSNGIIVHDDLIRENPEKAFEMYVKRNADQDKDKAWGEWTTGVDLFGAVAKKAQTPLQLAWIDPEKAQKTVDVIGELYKFESPVKPAEVYTNRFAEPLR